MLMQAVTDSTSVHPLKMMDITAPEGPVEVLVKFDNSILWINIEGVCVLRVCRITGGIEINDERLPKEKLAALMEKLK